MSYRLNAPMVWPEFKSMPPDLQKEYVSSLQEKYNARVSDFASMFGITGFGFRNYCKTKGIPLEKSSTGAKPKDEVDLWNGFLLPEGENAGDAGKIIEETTQETEPVSDTLPGGDVADEPTEAKENPMRMQEFSLTLSGEIDLHAVYNTLLYMMGDRANGKLWFNFRPADAED